MDFISPTLVDGSVHFHFSENGGRRELKNAFAHGCMLGLHLSLPRALGARAVSARITPDAGGEALCVPLSLVEMEGDREGYAALLDTARLFPHAGLFSLVLSLWTPWGERFVQIGEGDAAYLSEGEGDALPLILFEGMAPLLGGAVFFLPYEELTHTGAYCRGEDGDFDRFFAYLAAHGVRRLVLLVPVGEGAWDEGALTLPTAVRESAAAHGVCCLLDLLPFVFIHKAGRLAEPDDPKVYALDCAEGDALLSDIGGSVTPAALCGEEGILARGMSGGYGGVFLRYADRFGDPFLRAVRTELSARAPRAPFFVSTACTDLTHLPFGRRRRFLDGSVSGFASYLLRDALLAYLSVGDTALLSDCFAGYMRATPAPLLRAAIHPLDEPCGKSFAALLTPLLGDGGMPPAAALCAQAELIAATVTGVPTLSGSRGGEDMLAFRLRLFGMCRRERTLLSGALRLHTLRPDLLVFSRSREGEMLITVINRSPDTLVLSSPDGFSVLFGGRGRKLLFRVPPFGGTVLRFSLFTGECGRLTLERKKHIPHDTRFAPRAVVKNAKTS